MDAQFIVDVAEFGKEISVEKTDRSIVNIRALVGNMTLTKKSEMMGLSESGDLQVQFYWDTAANGELPVKPIVYYRNRKFHTISMMDDEDFTFLTLKQTR